VARPEGCSEAFWQWQRVGVSYFSWASSFRWWISFLHAEGAQCLIVVYLQLKDIFCEVWEKMQSAGDALSEESLEWYWSRDTSSFPTSHLITMAFLISWVSIFAPIDVWQEHLAMPSGLVIPFSK
jgi:hypothetical protein